METKIKIAHDMIRSVSKRYKNPIIYTGFGKDSMVVLSMCRDMGLDLPVMFHRENFFPLKYRFANKVIEDWDLRCYDYPWSDVSLFYNFGVLEIVRHYQIGGNFLTFCSMLYTPETFDDKYMCAYEDLIMAPRGSMNYIWDLGIQGYRSKETKPHYDDKPNGLKWSLKQNLDSFDVLFPIQTWSDEDVYFYSMEKGIPVNYDVYEVIDNKFVPRSDFTYNPDKRAACYECVNPDKPEAVYCPRKECTVSNISGRMRKAPMPIDFNHKTEK